jgi:hypothetical protein
MTIEQTVEIPANHQLFIDVPYEFPAGRASVRLVEHPVIPAENGMKTALKTRVLRGIQQVDREKAEAARLRLRGMFKTDGHDVDRFLARSHAERVRENWNDERQRQESLAFSEGRQPPDGEWVNPLLGIAADSDLTVERFIEMQEEEIDLENEYDERRRRISKKYRPRSET